jgi:hypothetical protein
MAALWIDDQNLAVEVQQRVQAGIANFSHHGRISIRDNMTSALRSRCLEQLVEDVAEPRFEHVHLGRRYRDALGPIVGDGLRREVMPGRTARKGPWLAKQLAKLFGRRRLRLAGRGMHSSSSVARQSKLHRAAISQRHHTFDRCAVLGEALATD